MFFLLFLRGICIPLTISFVFVVFFCDIQSALFLFSLFFLLNLLFRKVERMGFLIGQYTVPQTYLPILLPQTRTLALAVSTRSAAFLVLGYVLSGSPSSRILSALPMLLEGFLHPDALHSERYMLRFLVGYQRWFCFSNTYLIFSCFSFSFFCMHHSLLPVSLGLYGG